MRSRRCNAEQTLLKPLSDREGRGRDEAEPEELPDYQSPYGSSRSIVPASDGEGDFERIFIDIFAQ